MWALSQTFTFSVSTWAAPPVRYQWFFNRTNALPGAINSSLTMPNVQATDSGFYSVSISSFGTVTSLPARLDVLSLSITIQPTNHSVGIGGKTAFSVGVVGAQPIRYQWRLNGAPLAGATGSALNLTNVQSAQAGDYTVIVTNTYTAVTSSDATLTVTPNPIVSTCTEAALREAVGQGATGAVLFACDGIITLTNTLTNVLNTVIDATGHSISLGMADPGCCWYRPVLCIPTNTSLSLIGLTIDNGYLGGAGISSRAGGILNAGGTLNLVGVTLRNTALGMFGLAQGGAVANMGGWVNATNCLFSHNTAWSGTYNSTAGAQGGAVANILGWFTAQDCTFDSNAALGNRDYSSMPGENGTSAFGGAIYNTGALEMRNCTLSGNSASGAAGVSGAGSYNYLNGVPGGSGGSGLGSAIFSSGSAFLVNCTITGNQAGAADGGQGGKGATPGFGSCCGGNGGPGGNGGSGMGAIYATNGFAMTNCTFISNTAAAGHGAAGGAGGGAGMPPPHGVPGSPGPAGTDGVAYGGLVTTGAGLVNTLLSGNSPGGNCFGSVIDYGHNLSSDSTFSNPSSSNNTDPKLGPLADNGGLTRTMALLPGSPAIDDGDTASAPATDQRGFARPYGPAADIGAYEYGALAPPQPFSLTWTNNNGTITITGYIGTPAAITIPGTINGLPVTSIADRAFQYCSTSVSIAIGDSVTTIGTLAFQYCSGLTNVTIGKGLNTIGTFAFIGCANLTSVYFQGNAPTTGGGVLDLDNNATVYIQAGTTGWDSTFGGRPTALWAMPIILTPPRTQTAEAGSSVRFQARADGNPAVGYQWYFNGTNSLSVANRVLQLTNVQASDVGAYTVVAANAGASVTSTPAPLSVIPPVPRRPVPAVTLSGSIGTALNLDSRGALESSATWTNFDTVSLMSTSQWYFDVRTALAPVGFYRSWTTDSLNPPSPLVLHMVPAITLTGAIGNSVRLDAINQIGPTDAWWTLDTVTLTNTSQLYFDTSSIGQPPRLWRTAPVP